MDSEREDSPASSSVSSLSRRVMGVENDRSFRRPNIPIELDDFDSDTSDLMSLRNSSHPSAKTSPIEDYSSSIHKLPPEVLLLIFTNIRHKPDLVPLLLVCKRWASLLVELIWFRPSLMDNQALRGIREVMRRDRTSTYWDYRQYIRRLNLSFVYDKVDDEFLSLFAGSTNLERLTLVNCSRLSHRPIVDILQGCEKLQSIDMTGVKDITDEILAALAENCPRLQGLYAPGCPTVTNSVLFRIINSCPMLKRVKISDCVNLNDDTIVQLTEKCKFLIEVDVHNCPNITDFSLQKLFCDLDQLREFRISHNPNVSDILFRVIPEEMYLDRLRIIDLTGCLRITDRAVEAIVQCAPRLRNVVLSKCLNITDSSLRSLAALGKSLHYIHLGHCSNITDYGVVTLIKSCHRLQYIDLACCAQLTNLSLVELSSLPRLRRIGLVKCNNINDAGILALIQRRGYDDTLERVHLSYCTNIGLYPIFQLLQACPRLTHLSLTGISAFLRPDITTFCRSPPADFNDNQRKLFCVFSGQGVAMLRDHMTRLFLAQTHNNRFFMRDGPIEPQEAQRFRALNQVPEIQDGRQRMEENIQNLQRLTNFFRAGGQANQLAGLQAQAGLQVQAAPAAPPPEDEDEVMSE
ncbi:SCF E3 ubiquitin ligase complex F-box protein GRR1 [Wickerhamomyces ciferrii]|uniref:SCF E3 ubiquitin ligase complex F-box protein GRR1 n=1 Tax=Wickerhamomyces ciferrii (strain ATCC 14091 / BCRC 22168 / CBS 111 / JCM 3599 / NBRC 0793 / NRRL Y-1031 F-60-10) TaxID=1206466 RepID=K0KGQ1_WICCF|nr:SCF E3 ubiquitin ligase complex F-box protein GRR1 [Wickerhamomyces ciferrii]CCH40594.1 SCF E3 ubiquitin ligase complex F-box protein GRR1 [Wickerhamomyces ciferrii]